MSYRNLLFGRLPTWFIALTVFAVIQPGSIKAQHINDHDRRRLYNACRPMAVVVKRLSNDAKRIGLTEHRLWLAAVTHLRPVGIYSDSYDRAKTDVSVLLVPDRVAEILSPEFPGERLLVCLNPRLRQDRARKREELLKATEEILETIASAVRSPRSRLRGQEAINRRVGRDVSRKKVAKHFRIEVTDDDIRWSRRQKKIDAEAQLDGIYIVRTSLEASEIGAAEAVEAYKSPSQVERAIRSLKTAQLALRPV